MALNYYRNAIYVYMRFIDQLGQKVHAEKKVQKTQVIDAGVTGHSRQHGGNLEWGRSVHVVHPNSEMSLGFLDVEVLVTVASDLQPSFNCSI